MKFIKLLFLVILSIFPSNLIYSKDSSDPIINFLDNYNRSITVLEIGKSYNNSLYCKQFEKIEDKSITNVVILFEGSNALKEDAIKNNYKHMIVLEPYDLDPEMFRNLGRCEHFDLVIIHTDLFTSVRSSWDSYVDKFCKLGDHIIFDIDSKMSEINRKKITTTLKNITSPLGETEKNSFHMHKSNRKGLDIARWNKRYQSESLTPRYEIHSTFDSKLFIKSPNPALPWVDGINLSTFVMLRGIYPNDSIITDSLHKMSKSMPYHNDLIVGNIIIQGHNLVPIDFEDQRRNANMKRLFQRALNVFNGDGRRLIDPIKRMRIYSEKKK